MLDVVKKNKIKVRFSTGVKYKGIYYLAAIDINALFIYEEKIDKLTYLMSFKQEKKKKFLYLRSYLYKNEIWFIPYQAEYIAIVNLEKLSVRYMPLLFRKEYNNITIKYINILPFKEDFLCLLPAGVDSIMIIDLKNKNAKAYYDVVDKNIHYNSAVYLNEKIYCFPWKGTSILVLDLNKNVIKHMQWIKQNEEFGDVIYNEKNEKLYHAPAKGKYILIDNLEGKVHEKIEIKDLSDDKYNTYYSTNKNEDIFFWGHENNVIVKIHKDNDSLKTYIIDHKNSGCYFYPICSTSIEAISFNGNCIIKYNEKDDTFSEIYIKTNFYNLMQTIEEGGGDFKEIYGNPEKIIWEENNEFGLSHFLYCCSKKNELESISKIANIGNKIYKAE